MGKALIVDREERTSRQELGQWRTRPYGRPEDMAQGMKAGGR